MPSAKLRKKVPRALEPQGFRRGQQKSTNRQQIANIKRKKQIKLTKISNSVTLLHNAREENDGYTKKKSVGQFD